MASKYLQNLFTYLGGQKLAMGSTDKWRNMQTERVTAAVCTIRGMSSMSMQEASQISGYIVNSPLDQDQKEILAVAINEKVNAGVGSQGLHARASEEDGSQRLRAHARRAASPTEGSPTGVMGPARTGVIDPDESPTAQTDPVTEQIHNDFESYCTRSDWNVLLDKGASMEDRLRCLARRVARVGLFHGKEKVYGRIVALAMLDQEDKIIHSSVGLAWLRRFKANVKSYVKLFRAGVAPSSYPPSPKMLGKDFYKVAYEDEASCESPISLETIVRVQRLVPLRDTNVVARDLPSGAAPKYAKARTSREPAMGGLGGSAMGGHMREDDILFAKMGKSIVATFPQVEEAMEQPWFRAAISSEEPALPLWKQVFFSSPEKKQKEVKIELVRKPLADDSTQPMDETPSRSPDSQPSAEAQPTDAASETTPKAGKQLPKDVEQHLALVRATGAERASPMKSRRRKVTKRCMKAAAKGAASMKTAAKGAISMKAAKSVLTSTAEGERGVKCKAFLVFKAGKRAPFWYGKSKVHTQWVLPGPSRWRVYKVSPQDKVESAFGFSTLADARKQWHDVVALLNKCNP